MKKDVHTSFREISDVANKVFDFAELGSKEFKTSTLLNNFLKEKGFKTVFPYKGMKTSFRADYGAGKPTVCFLCEEDALPNGHSCGHNLIAAWAVGSAVKLKEAGYSGRIVVIGTPSEEGIGDYAGSKDRLVNAGAFDDIDFAIGFHPDSEWGVGCQSPNDITFDIIFKGKASDLQNTKFEKNALDALVAVYVGIQKIESSKRGGRLIISMFIKEGGEASNIVPETTRMEVDLRSLDDVTFRSAYSMIKKSTKRSGNEYRVKTRIKELTPLYRTYVNAVDIDKILFKNLAKRGIKAGKLYIGKPRGMGATDEANVSRVVPTGHLDMKISPKNAPGHSDAFRRYAGSKEALHALKKAVDATVESCVEIQNDENTLIKLYAFKKTLRSTKHLP